MKIKKQLIFFAIALFVSCNSEIPKEINNLVDKTERKQNMQTIQTFFMVVVGDFIA